MNCPVCKTSNLKTVNLDQKLTAARCETCAGHWVSGREYQIWLEQHGAPEAEKPYSGPELEIADSQTAKICPECRRLLLRYIVGHGTGFGIDQCSSCFGIWFDRGEWDALRGRNLHDEVNRIFTAPWQTEARREERREQLARIYRREFGDDYEEVRRVRDWIRGHNAKDRLLAFLTDANPYDA